MHSRSTQRGQILIIVLGAILLGGAVMAAGVFGTGRSLDDLDKAVKKDIADDTRRDAARKVIDQWSTDVKAFLKESGNRQKTVMKLMRRHDATRPNFEAIVAEQELAGAAIDQRAIEHRFALKEQLSREEWANIFPARN